MDVKKTTSFIKLGNTIKFTLRKDYFGCNYYKKYSKKEVVFLL